MAVLPCIVNLWLILKSPRKRNQKKIYTDFTSWYKSFIRVALAGGKEMNLLSISNCIVEAIILPVMTSQARFLLILAIIFFSYYFLSFVLVHLLERGINPLRYSVSHNASTSHRPLLHVQMLVKSAGYICLAVFLLLNFPSTQSGSWILVASAAVGLLAPLFPINENHRPFQTSDYIHLAIAGETFILLVIAINSITADLVATSLLTLPGFAEILSTLAFDSLLAFAICFFLPPLKRVAGLAERVFILSTLAWFFLVSIQLMNV
jgi:hypothetical protein